MESLRFLIAASALGAMAVWGSEVLFWTAPTDALSAPDLALTWLAYSIAAAAALAMVITTGCGGLRGAFLGGAILGYLAEGVMVGTIYDAFPFQLVWTPLAWHALITGVGVFALGRAAVHWRLRVQVAAMVCLGALGGVWGWFWPVERADLPGFGATFAYLVGLGLFVPVAQMVLDRLGAVPHPPRWVLAAPWAIAALVWVLSSLADPRPTRLALPLVLGLTVWIMARLGAGMPTFGAPPAHPLRHAVMLLAPLVAAPVAVMGWQMFGAVEVNIPFALLTCALALGWWLRLLWLAYRAPNAVSAAPRSSAPS